MAQMDLSPVPDPRLQKPVLPLAQGAPESQPAPSVPVPSQATAAPMAQTAQPAEKLNTVPLAFPQLGQQSETQNQQTLRQTQQRGSGISNIHNPILKTLATIGDVVAGTFAPRAEQLIPGTEGNYALHLARAGNAVKGEEEQLNAPIERNLKTAQTRHATAQADALENPSAKPPTNEFELWHQQNPGGTVEDYNKILAANKPVTGTVHEDAQGNYWIIHPDGTAKQVAPQGQPLKAKTPAESGGTVHEDAEGNMWVVKGDGTAVPVTPKQPDQPTTGTTPTAAPAATTPPAITPTVAPAPPKQLKGKPQNSTETPEAQFVKEYQASHHGATVAQAQRAYKLNEQLPPQRDPDVALDRESKRFAATHEKAVADATTQLEKIADARAMINGSAEAQALGVPKVLTALVSGPGSGVRITQPELNSIATARGVQGSLEGFVSQLSGKGKLNDTQKQQLTQILDDVAGRVQQKQSIANEAKDKINSARSRDEIIKADQEATKKLIDMQKSGGQASNAKPAEGGYRVGGKYSGKEYLGGPPTDPNSWK